MNYDSEQQVQAVFTNAPDAIIVIDNDGYIQKWNPVAEKLFGWTEDEVSGKSLHDIIIPERFHTMVAAGMQELIATGSSPVSNKTLTLSALRKNHKEIEIEFTVSPVKLQDHFWFIAFLRDATERRRAEEALRESEEKFRHLSTEVYEYAIIMLSAQGLVTSWNVGAQRLYGYTESEIVGKHFSLFYPKEDIENNIPEKELNNVNKQGRFENEGWKVKKDGSLFCANVLKTAVVRDGRIIGYSKITKDITVHKKAEKEIKLLNSSLEHRVKERTEELQQSENKYRKLFENSPMPMWVIELPSFKFIDVNEAAIQQYGYSRAEFLSMTAVDIRPDDEKIRFQNFNRTPGMGMVNTGVWKHLKKDRSIIYAEVNSHSLNTGARQERLVLSTDITERHKAEERLDIALEAGKIGIWELDILQDVSSRNTRFDQIFGHEDPPAEWGMKQFLAQVHSNDLLTVRKAFAKALITGTLYVETRITLPDESIRWIIATGKTIEDNQENPVRMLGTVTDITELKTAEERIRMLNNDLEQRVQLRTRELHSANKELESFSYSVSHDLRAPLRAIHGYSQLLNENYKTYLDDEGKRMLDRVMHNTQKMSRLIDDLLEFSRLGKAALRKQHIDLTQVAQSVVNELRQSALNFHHEIQVGNLGVAYTDKIIIRQVFENLLSNAVKYSAKKDNPVVEVGVTETAKGKSYYVKDNGAGFDMAYYNKLFGVFQRLHRQDEFEGTGVGLAIVQKIIFKHSGEIWAEGVVDEGATFYFTLETTGRNENG